MTYSQRLETHLEIRGEIAETPAFCGGRLLADRNLVRHSRLDYITQTISPSLRVLFTFPCRTTFLGRTKVVFECFTKVLRDVTD